MQEGWFDKVWYKGFKRPYALTKRYDTGEGNLVILLHGVGRTAEVWDQLVADLKDTSIQVVAYDLLGFGESPKPQWLNYSVDDHAKSVIKSIEKLETKNKIILVGHSMGSLIALRVARLRPDLVKHLILFEMPLYRGLPNKRMYRLRLNFYYKLYTWAQEYSPTFDSNTAAFKERLAKKFFGLEVDKTSWIPFVKSLEHTIFEQTAPQDIKKIKMPMDVIYGSYDMLVIRGTVKHVIEDKSEHLKVFNVRTGHTISKKASEFLKQRIINANHEQ